MVRVILSGTDNVFCIMWRGRGGLSRNLCMALDLAV